jgi:hypothetical protein
LALTEESGHVGPDDGHQDCEQGYDNDDLDERKAAADAVATIGVGVAHG